MWIRWGSPIQVVELEDGHDEVDEIEYDEIDVYVLCSITTWVIRSEDWVQMYHLSTFG